MIFRLSGEGQFDVPAESLADLNSLDASLTTAIEAGDESGYHALLERLAEQVRQVGSIVAADRIVPSEVIIPAADTSLEQVRQLLGDDGLIPG